LIILTMHVEDRRRFTFPICRLLANWNQPSVSTANRYALVIANPGDSRRISAISREWRIWRRGPGQRAGVNRSGCRQAGRAGDL